MPLKDWREYPRVIPNDEAARRDQQDRVMKEYKVLNKWYDTYGEKFGAGPKCYMCPSEDCGETSTGESSRDNDVTSETIRRSPNSNEELRSVLYPCPGSGRGMRDDFQPSNERFKECPCHPVIRRSPEYSEEDSACRCIRKDEQLAKMRELEFPPKCNHACAKLGFHCWMCQNKSPKC